MINITLCVISILILTTREIYFGKYFRLEGSGKPTLADRYAIILELLLAALTITLLAIIAININWK